MSDEIRFEKVAPRTEALGGDAMVDDLDEIPAFFIRFESPRDVARWLGLHRPHRGHAYDPPVSAGRWYAAYQYLEYAMGSCCGTAWQLRPAAEGVKTLREIHDGLAAQLDGDLAVVAFEELAEETSCA